MSEDRSTMVTREVHSRYCPVFEPKESQISTKDTKLRAPVEDSKEQKTLRRQESPEKRECEAIFRITVLQMHVLHCKKGERRGEQEDSRFDAMRVYYAYK